MTKYDDADFHEGAALDAAQPVENAFTHIGLYLGWLIRHEMVNPEFFTEQDLAEVKAGTMTGSDLQGDVDGKLMSDMLTADGEAFSDWYYEKYLDDYSAAFPDRDAYSIADDVGSRSRIDPVIDGRYAEWSEAGKPGDDLADIPEYKFTPKYGPDDPAPSFEQIRRDLDEAFAREGIKVEVTSNTDMPRPHSAPELERLLPAELRPDSWSVAANHWGDPKLRRALKQLGVSTKAAHVVTAIESAKGGSRTVVIYSVLGMPIDRLEAEFVSVLRISGTKDTGIEIVGGRSLHRSLGPSWVSAWWAQDGLVVSCGATNDDELRSLIERID